MEKIKFATIFAISILFFSCSGESDDDMNSPMQGVMKEYRHFEQNRTIEGKLYAGDTIAYYKVRNIFFDSGNKRAFLYNAITMSSIYNFPPAAYDVYFILHSDRITDENTYMNQIANYYLLKAFEGKAVSKKEVLERLGRNSGKLPKSEDYLCQINKNKP